MGKPLFRFNCCFKTKDGMQYYAMQHSGKMLIFTINVIGCISFKNKKREINSRFLLNFILQFLVISCFVPSLNRIIFVRFKLSLKESLCFKEI